MDIEGDFFQIITDKHNDSTYNIYIGNSIASSNSLFQLIDFLRHRSLADNINMYINSDGGGFYPLMQILNAMDDCLATITTICDGVAASSAAFMFLAGEEHDVKPNSVLMMHFCELTTTGKIGEVQSRVKFQTETFRKMVISTCKNFLTRRELNSMFNGRELLFSSDDMIKRLSI